MRRDEKGEEAWALQKTQESQNCLVADAAQRKRDTDPGS